MGGAVTPTSLAAIVIDGWMLTFVSNEEYNGTTMKMCTAQFLLMNQ